MKTFSQSSLLFRLYRHMTGLKLDFSSIPNLKNCIFLIKIWYHETKSDFPNLNLISSNNPGDTSDFELRLCSQHPLPSK